MSILGILGKVITAVAEKSPEVIGKMATEASKMQSKALESQGRQITDYEQKIKRIEQSGRNLTLEQKQILEEKKQTIENRKQKLSSMGCEVRNGEILYGDKSIKEWERNWKSIGYLKDADLTPYNKCVGLYRHKINGEVKYIGRAIELNNGGFRKRLSDYRRESDSARHHESGKIINENLDKIITDILIVGETNEAINTTKILEPVFIKKYNPIWNKQNKNI